MRRFPPFGQRPTAPDGYLRMAVAELAAARFEHLFSEYDACLLQDLRQQGCSACAAGVTEWISVDRPAISVAWSWFADGSGVSPSLADPVRSNLMLICAKGYDLGPRRTSSLLHAWLEVLPWREQAMLAMRIRTTC